MNNCVKISLFLIVIFMVACAQRPKIDVGQVDSLLFGTLPYGVETRQALSSVAMVTHSKSYKDTIYKSPEVIHRFVSLVNQLSPERKSRNTIDLRKISLVFLKDGSILQLGFGDYWDTVYEGKRMKDNEELFQFLDSLLYAPYPPEHWWDEDTKEMIESLMKGQ